MGITIKGRRQWLGIVLLVLSSLSYVALPVVPFLSLSLAQKAQLGSAIYGFSWLTWIGCLALLGRSFVEQLSAPLKRFWLRLREGARTPKGSRGQADTTEVAD